MNSSWASRSWVPPAAGVGVLLGAILLWRSLLADQKRHVQFMAESEARAAAADLQTGLQSLTDVLAGIAQRFGVSLREDRPWDFRLTGLQAALWVEPSGKVGWASPRDGNGSWAAADLSANSADREALRRAAEFGRPAVTRTLDLPDDSGKGFRLIVPVAVAGRLEGFLVGVFGGDAIYDIFLAGEASRGWALAVFEGDRELYRRGSPTDGWTARSEVAFLDADWSVRAAPSPAIVARLRSRAPAVVLVAGPAIALLLAAAVSLAQSSRRRAVEAESAQAALSARDAQLRAILDNTMAVIYIKDAEGRYLLVNRSMHELFGSADASLLGRTDRDFLPEDTAAKVRANDLKVLESRAPLQVEETAPFPDGPRTYLSVKVPLFDAACLPYAICGISTDITEQKRYEEMRQRSLGLEEESRRAQEANRLKSEFLANMSHELRTPLNAIIGFSELMHDGRVGPLAPQQQEFVSDILASSRHLLQLINDVLDLSKIEAGKMEFHPEPLAPVKVATEIRDVLRSLAVAKRIAVTVEAAGSPAEVVVDAGKLKQVIYNYLSNALKFTPEGGRVSVRLTAEGASDFRLEVEDNGIGIQPEDMGRLFVQFQQLDGTSTKKYPGTGLGLALTKRIVEAQGGTVGARSRAGEGSVFFAVLPKGLQPVAAQPSVGDPAGAGAATHGRGGVVVEDSEES